MADLPWDKFLKLPGDPRKNWEVLCREVIRRHYERYGPLLTRKQQPGIEFHLSVERGGGELGDAGRHWGWQCKWYEPDAFRQDGNLRRDQRRLIEEAIKKSAEHVPKLTDWVLWTREKLSADDSRWFEDLEASFTLRNWDEETLIGVLSGPAEVLLQTWFGELILDQETLTQHWREALSPIAQRYVEELHVRTPPETQMEMLLPGPALAERLTGLQERLAGTEADLDLAIQEGQTNELDELPRRTVAALVEARARLAELRAGLDEGHLPSSGEVEAAAGSSDAAGELEEMIKARIDRRHDVAWRFGRAERTLGATRRFLADLASGLRTPLLVALGGAGAGKTHLAASISGPEREARGVLVLGRQFGAEIGDDDIARFSVLAATRDELLEAMEAVGLREGRRVPLVVDGINESDNPSSWQDVLARLQTRLATLPHVLALVTVRPSYRDFALPADAAIVELAGLAGVEVEAIGRYFDYYKIDAHPAALHWWRPSDPLLLGIFCRAVNPERRERIAASQLPGSLTEVFETYLQDVRTRIARTMDIPPEDIEAAMLRLGERFFERRARELDRRQVSEVLGDPKRARMKESLRFQLENEEILVRDVIEGAEQMMWSYDLLGGHLIAKGLLESDGHMLETEEGLETLEEHPLREDIITGLSGLMAARGAELSALVAERTQLAEEAALASVRLPGPQVGEAAVEALHRLFAARSEEVLEATNASLLRPEHPLNGRLLDRLLGDMAVWERDLSWTEWVRRRSETVVVQIGQLTVEWRAERESEDDEAALVWLSWLLTSTDKPLRDAAIHALYRFGRRKPELLFARALQMLDINDPAIAEGLMAASYGVAMSAQDPASEARGPVLDFATELQARLLGESATQPSFHWLIREYAYRTTQLATWLSDGDFPAAPDAAQPPLPAPAVEAQVFELDSEEWKAVGGAFHMDFSNYTIGRLVEDRANYQDDHPRFLEITGEIRARVAELGWSEERFKEIDRAIAERSYTRSDDPEKVERYGKKYSWAGFYEAAGRLSDRRELRMANGDGWRLSDLPIDPSFPEGAARAPFELPEWVPTSGEDEEWVRSGEIEIPDELLCTSAFKGNGPWVAIDGFLRQQPHESERKVFCFIRGVLALEGWPSVESYINEHGVEPELVPNNASDHYCFAGETPWAATFDSYATAADGSFEPEVTKLGRRQSDGPKVELLGVDFNWESYHSTLNDAEIGSLPSKSFAFFAGLRKLPDRPEFVDAGGRPAARAVSLEGNGWSGHILYVRQEHLESYCDSRGGEWGWVVWGERELMLRDRLEDTPPWLSEVGRRGDDRFHRVTTLSELAATP